MLIPARRKLLGSELRREEEAQRMRQLNEEYCSGLFKSMSQKPNEYYFPWVFQSSYVYHGLFWLTWLV